jgi:predicted nucleotide-binding protein
MIEDIEKLIESAYYFPYSKESFDLIKKALSTLTTFVEKNHFLKSKDYLNEIEQIRLNSEDLSNFRSAEDRLLQKKIQKNIANLSRKILEENRKIFIVHGRNINMRDKVSSLLGRLKLDYVILETEHNNGATVIEKFLRNAKDCRYAIILFSADDLGKLNQTGGTLKPRVRQNVILELGYFLAVAGRKNIVILHEVGKEIEKPSDFDGIVYEPFDDYGAWKGKLIKEMKKANIHIDQSHADKA